VIVRRLLGAWNRFWFEPQPSSTLAVFRIAFGLVTLGWALALLPNIGDFFTRDGIEPVPVDVTWGVLGHLPSDAVVYPCFVALLVSAVCVTVGFRTRLASVILFVTVFSFIERSHPIFNSGDGLIRNLAFLVMFMPAGESLSVDRWLANRDRFWEFPARAPWALRLVQIQVSVLYLSAMQHKIAGGGWTDGSALSYVWRMDDLVRFRVPEFVIQSVTISTLASLLTLAIEAMLVVFVWVRSTRALVIGLGVALHLGIELSLRIGFFSMAIFAAYVAFLTPERASSLVLAARDRRRRRRQPVTVELTPPPAEA